MAKNPDSKNSDPNYPLVIKVVMDLYVPKDELVPKMMRDPRWWFRDTCFVKLPGVGSLRFSDGIGTKTMNSDVHKSLETLKAMGAIIDIGPKKAHGGPRDYSIYVHNTFYWKRFEEYTEKETFNIVVEEWMKFHSQYNKIISVPIEERYQMFEYFHPEEEE